MTLVGWAQTALTLVVSLGGAVGALLLLRMVWVLLHPEDP